MNFKKLIPVSCLSLLPLVSFNATADAGQWKYTTGFDYSTGDYGGDPKDTDITYIPFTAAYSTGNWTFKGTVSWVEIDGPGTVVGAGEGGVVRPGAASTETSTESGMGDIWLGATYSVESVPTDLFYLDLGAKVKLPTADEDKGLGTGETDYTLQADIFKPMGKLMPFATVAYKIKGDPSDYQLDNVIYLSGGGDYKYSQMNHIGMTMDYQEASTDSGDDQLELMAYLNHKLDRQWSLMFYGYKGLDDGSPDYGFGIQVSYKP